MYNLPICKISY